MIIGIDGNEANVDQLVGVSVYVFNLLEYFQKSADEHIQFLVYLRDIPKKKLPPENYYFRYRVISSRILWSQFFLPLDLFSHRKIDIFFSPAHYAPRFCPVPTVITVHDLAYFYFPNEFLKKDLYKLEHWTKYSARDSKRIIAVSKATKKDLMHFYQIPDKKITVIYNGFEKNNIDKTDLSPHLFLKSHQLENQKYILYVGTLQPRKNLPLLISSFHKFKQKYPDFKLVLTGKKGWLYEDIYKEVEKNKLTQSVLFTGYVSDAELVYLYRNAACYVLPSLYEGFGIPLLEAMSQECPVISSFSSSLPEIGGEACIYFDPQDDNDLYDKLILLQNDPHLRKELIMKGKERIKSFSWKKCAEETLTLIKNTAEKND